jgi:hypothetical protein
MTDNRLRIIRTALHNAWEERMSYADAWPKDSPERAAPLAAAASYAQLLQEMFGEKPIGQQIQEETAAAERVDIFKLSHRKPDNA